MIPSDRFSFICRLLLCLVFIWAGSAGADGKDQAVSEQHLKIGVLAFRGERKTEQNWEPTIKYLSLAVPGVTFTLLPLTLEQMEQAVQEHTVSFIITNPGNYVDLEYRYGVSRIATLQRFPDQSPSQRTYSTILVRAEREDLQDVSDLKGQRVMAVSPNAFGGFQLAWGEMQRYGLDPYRDLSELVFSGFPLDNIVTSVQSGQVDAGIVRGCLLEQMDSAGLINIADFRVVNERLDSNGKCKVSTPGYPDWPLAKLSGTSDQLAKLVTMTLLAMPRNHRAAIAGEYSGWTIPVEYQAVHELFRELQIGPYEWMRRPTVALLWSRYWQWFLIAFMGVVWWLWHVYRVEQLVRVRTAQLTEANARLQAEMNERQQAEQKLLSQQNELAHVVRVSTAGELASGLAHELNQPLSAISSYAQGCIWRLESGRISQDELREIIQRMVSEAERAGAIIQRLRGFLRKEQSLCRPTDINGAVRDAIELFTAEANRRGISLSHHLAQAIPPVCSETIQLQQVIINLLRNAADALKGLPDEQQRIELTTRHDPNEGTVQIDVRDFGPGIDPDSKPRLFEPFFTTTSDGMGLGLSLSQSIVESHGGTIRVIDDVQPGACFSIVLPVYKETADAD